MADAGLSAALPVSAAAANLTAFGALAGNQFQATAGQPPTLTGAGVDGDPFVVTSNYDAVVGRRARSSTSTGRVSYVNGVPRRHGQLHGPTNVRQAPD